MCGNDPVRKRHGSASGGYVVKKDGFLNIAAEIAAGCTALILAVFLLRIGAAVVFSGPGTDSEKEAEGDILCVCFPFWSVFTKNADIYLAEGEDETQDGEMLDKIYNILNFDMLKGQDRVNIHLTDMDRLDLRYFMLRLVLPQSEHRYDEYVQSPDAANFHYFRYTGFK